MKQLSSAQIRQLFLDFFKERGHKVEPSASLVPIDDPTLLWINSGVATLKKYFDGSVIPENPCIVNVQKSIRTNDIENVGFTARHHTFFEMLGNFSIGDYFKERAIVLAWEFLTSEKWLGFDEDLLSVTVHPEDDEAFDIWLNKIKLSEHRIIRLEENFWDIGIGPSGPNTEIFYDRGETYGSNPNDPELYPGGENDRYLEIWNLVFSQFNHNPDDSYTPLPNKNIDTGMGLERLVSIIQDAPTNFETDLFMPIIKEVELISKKTYGKNDKDDSAFKVIVDHIRTVSFAIGDGALPSNEGRGYVLRRLIRRAVRFAKQLGIEEPFMYKLVSVVGNVMKDFYPEVLTEKDLIVNIVKMEEERFHETLNDGLDILGKMILKEKANGNNVITGVDVFKLYDTYGFPKELTQEYVAEHEFSIDDAGFESEMKKQRERARNARQQTNSMHVQDEVLATLDVESAFLGYDQLEVVTTISSIIKENSITDVAHADDEVMVVLNETPFYAESGGQIADNGWLSTDEASAEVIDVQKAPHGQNIHYIRVKSGTIKVGERVVALVNKEKRNRIVKNHTATHILHQALRDILGDHVTQAGSRVSDERLRFDFKHFGSISQEELDEIEEIVNQKIWASLPVLIESKSIDEAKEMGAMALFGEKYGKEVRVVQIEDYSIELCGGCHILNTAEIGLFKIASESGIGSGTRRIEAFTSIEAYHFLHEKIALLQKTSHLLKTSEEQVPKRIESLFDEVANLTKVNQSLNDKLTKVESSSMMDDVEIIDDINVLAKEVSATDMKQLRSRLDEAKKSLKSSVILLAAENNGKVLLASSVSKDLIDRGLHAGNLIKQAAELCGGGGGGRPDMAQAGGKDPKRIKEALQFTKLYVAENLE